MLRETEIGQVAAVARADQDVSGLHIPVNQPALVCGVERLSDRPEQAHRAVGVEPSLALEHAPQVSALHVAHRQEQPSIGLPRGVDGNDAGVVERGRDTALSEEAGAEPLVVRQIRREHLQRDRAIQMLVACQVHNPGRSAPKLALDPIARQHRADGQLKRHRSRIHDGRRARHLPGVERGRPNGARVVPRPPRRVAR